MHFDLANHLDLRGFITRPELIAAGFADNDVRTLKRQLRLHTVGPGLYASSNFANLTPEDQHRLRAHAVSTRFRGVVALSHQSAALLHGAATWQQDLSRVHVTRLDTGRGRHQAGVAHHVAQLPSSEVCEVDGLLVTNPARTAWDIAVASSIESGLATVDSFKYGNLVTDDELLELVTRYSSWRGARRAKLTLSLSTELAESPGESRTRFLFRQAGIPQPILQYRVEEASGRLIGITDFAWPEFRLLGEFDGMVKYGKPEDLGKEKVREDRLRAQGWGMIRLVWADLAPSQQRATAERVRDALRKSARVHAAHLPDNFTSD